MEIIFHNQLIRRGLIMMKTTIHNSSNFLFIWKKFNEGESTRISDELSLIGIGPSFRGEK